MESCHVRIAGGEDAEKLLAIYAPYVENTAITFEYEVPSIEEFRERIEHTLSRYPYLVAERGGEILGYAYAYISAPTQSISGSASFCTTRSRVH